MWPSFFWRELGREWEEVREEFLGVYGGISIRFVRFWGKNLLFNRFVAYQAFFIE